MAHEKKRVVVAMSGGVDSSLAAALLLEQGYEVIGVTMQIWEEVDPLEEAKLGGCCSLDAVGDARRVANALGIPYYVMNMREIFKEKVIDYFTSEYARGRTPNPCIACNQFVKFDALLTRALALEGDYVATGHYAVVSFDETLGRYVLERSADAKKDQTYALYNMKQSQLARTLFPLGGYTKTETRRLAEERGLVTARKPDSQEICFVKNDDYTEFLREAIPDQIERGDFVDTTGKVLGRHNGIPFYTIGQRRGLGIWTGKPMYVKEIDAATNTIVLGESHEVYDIGLVANRLNWILFDDLAGEIEVEAQIRYNARPQPAVLVPEGAGRTRVLFKEPQRAITPGQAIVFYQRDRLVGGGTIDRVLHDENLPVEPAAVSR